MDDSLRDLIFQAIDETISDSDFDRLQDAIEQNPEVLVEYLRAVSLCESLAEIANDPSTPVADDPSAPAAGFSQPDQETTLPATGIDSNKTKSTTDASGSLLRQLPAITAIAQWNGQTMAVAAAVLILVSGSAFWLGQQKRPLGSEVVAPRNNAFDESPESRIAGHATLRRVVDLKWPADAARRREGDVLPNGAFSFEEGVAEIDFFCGATLIVEGPAELDIESDWSVRVARGRLRATVPRAARGFTVKAADSDIVDLGTEFAVEVGVKNARVEVIDGEVELRGGEHDGQHLLTGESQSLKGTQKTTRLSDGLSTTLELQQRQQEAEQLRFTQWKAHSQKLRTDQRLIAWYPIALGESSALAAGSEGPTHSHKTTAFGTGDRVVPNVAKSGIALNGLLVGPVNRTAGRFATRSAGLNFDRPGARVRTRIDGEFSAFTFACWVRIDSLEHRYNALFMADGYETGEPHWQIRDDGSLMFSVMVDDTQKIRHFSREENRIVRQAGLHHVYYTQPFWDISKSGQWFHLAAVYDPKARRVTQFVNGKRIASEEIVDKFHISSLSIGAAEIGNWGQPFRDSPWFAVRNLNGTIDELAIFGAALTPEELNDLYQHGMPVGY